MSAARLLQLLLASLGQVPLTGRESIALDRFLELLLKWNKRLSLTAIRVEDEIVRRHFLESILLGRSLPPEIHTLLDYGSGAGFPGIPLAICHPDLRITLAESNTKKASFLREAVRTLELQAEVHSGRVEDMAPERLFDAASLRAVDRMQKASARALTRVREGGFLALMTTTSAASSLLDGLKGLEWRAPVALPGGDQQVILIGKRVRL